MRRWLPHPLIFLALLTSWLLLTGSITLNTILLGSGLAFGGSWALSAVSPPKMRLNRLTGVPALLVTILVEVVRSNNAVARIILGRNTAPARQSGFVRIQLELRSPYGLAALACILTATPGTVWVEYNSVEGTMLLHVLDLADEQVWVHIVKEKWERQLMEIFE